MATAPESHYVLDGILGNQTDLPVTEHATDTHGATLANFALFDLLGLQLSSRIRDLGKSTLYRTGPKAEFASRYPSAGQLLARRLNEELITGMWDDLLRVAASVEGGHATVALVVGKLCSSRRQQSALAAAIKEYGALRRTVYANSYLADEATSAGSAASGSRAKTCTRCAWEPAADEAADRADVVPDPGPNARDLRRVRGQRCCGPEAADIDDGRGGILEERAASTAPLVRRRRRARKVDSDGSGRPRTGSGK